MRLGGVGASFLPAYSVPSSQWLDRSTPLLLFRKYSQGGSYGLRHLLIFIIYWFGEEGEARGGLCGNASVCVGWRKEEPASIYSMLSPRGVHVESEGWRERESEILRCLPSSFLGSEPAIEWMSALCCLRWRQEDHGALLAAWIALFPLPSFLILQAPRSSFHPWFSTRETARAARAFTLPFLSLPFEIVQQPEFFYTEDPESLAIP